MVKLDNDIQEMMKKWLDPNSGKEFDPHGFDKEFDPEPEEQQHTFNGHAGAQQSSTGQSDPPPRPKLLWHGETLEREKRTWLVNKLIPERGCGLLSGQWGSAKTFGAFDLAGSVMTGRHFAGQEVARPGGVVLLAAEGQDEVQIRIQAIVDHKLKMNPLPFAWIEEVPSLKFGFDQLLELVSEAAARMRERFDLPLSLIEIDTLNAIADFKDGNDAAEGQLVMNRLRQLSLATGAFVLAVDHFGKDIEAGTRGSSAKEASADVILAFLAQKSIGGNVSNLRMAVRKVRGGKQGQEFPFELEIVDAPNNETTCIVNWNPTPQQDKGSSQRDPWSGGAAIKTLRESLAQVISREGKDCDLLDNGKAVKAVKAQAVRTEFMKRYPSDSEKKNAKRTAYHRALNTAIERNPIGSREVDGEDYLWFIPMFFAA